MYQQHFLLWRCDPTRVMSSFLRFVDHTRLTTVGRTPLDEWSPRRRDLYLTTHNIHNRQTSMPPVGFEPTISAGERPQTYALDRAATRTGVLTTVLRLNKHTWGKPGHWAQDRPARSSEEMPQIRCDNSDQTLHKIIPCLQTPNNDASAHLSTNTKI